jgi:2-hydroxymuconate-semialdehyde hydrolase
VCEVRREQIAVGGADLSVLRAGDGPPVVLLHGIPTGAHLWEDVLARLARSGFHAVAPDLPGYGATRLPAGADHSLAAAAALLARWVDAAGLAPAWIIGHDAGGAVAQILAVQHPWAVSGLTLTNSIADGFWPAPRARFATLAARARLVHIGGALRMLPNPYVRRQLHRAFADPRRAAAVDVDRVVWDGKVGDRAGRRAFERHLAALTPSDTAAVVDGLRSVSVPCQLVWGMQDPFQPWTGPGRRLAALLPSASVSHLDGCGHFTPLECPDRLVDALVDWYRKEMA